MSSQFKKSLFLFLSFHTLSTKTPNSGYFQPVNKYSHMQYIRVKDLLTKSIFQYTIQKEKDNKVLVF